MYCLPVCASLWLLAQGWLIILCVKDVLAQSDWWSSVALLFSRSPQAKWEAVGRNKGSKPSMSVLSLCLSPFLLLQYHSSPIPSIAQKLQSWTAGNKVSPWTISFLELLPNMTQDSSKCQYDLVDISFFDFPSPALFHRIRALHIPCLSLLSSFILSFSDPFFPSLRHFCRWRLPFLPTEFCCIGSYNCHVLLCSHHFRFNIRKINQTGGWAGCTLVCTCYA